MARESTPNIGLTYETDKNNNFSYDNDIKNNLIAIDNAIKADRDRLDKLDQPEKLTITTTSNIFTLENTVKGQVSVTLKGVTRIQLAPTNEADWEQGTLSATTGAEASGTNKIRNTDFINLKPSTNYTFDFNENYQVAIFEYQSDGTFIKYSGFKTTKTTITTDSLTGKIRIVVIRDDGADLLPSEISQVYLILEEGDATGNFITTGVKSTVCAYRIKDTGKNLFDGELEVGGLSTSTGETVTVTGRSRSKNFNAIKANQSYRLSCNTSEVTYTTDTRIFFYDSNRKYISNHWITSSAALTFTTPSNAKYFKIYNASTDNIYAEYQVEEGTIATEYEPYKESVSYILATDENGNIIEKHSLPNGTKDEVNVSEGKLTKNTKQVILDGTDIAGISDLTNSQRIYTRIFTDARDLGNGTNNDFIIPGYPSTTVSGGAGADEPYTSFHIYQRFYIHVPLGTYASLAEAQADLAGTTLIYQLEQPKYYDLVGVGDLYTFNGETTIIIEPTIRFEAIADSNGQITIPHSEYPIDYIEKVQEKTVDGDSISYIDASYSQVDNLTIGGLTYGKKYQVIYHYPQELTTGPELTVTYPVNIAASISDIFEIQRRLEKELGTVWLTLIPLADKELGMYMITEISTPAAVTTEELGNKINEILSVWKGE